jgi:hypothetical protein
MKHFFLVLFLLALYSCSSEIARIDLTTHENISMAVNCKKDQQIDFYLDCDIEYKEMANMVMDFEFFKGTEQILKGGLDPLAAPPKSDESKVVTKGKTRWTFYGKLEGNFIPKEDTIYIIKPTLIKNSQSDLIINKLELVLVR